MQAPESQGVTVGDVKIHLLTQRLAAAEVRHAQEVLDLQAQWLLEKEELLQQIRYLSQEDGMKEESDGE